MNDPGIKVVHLLPADGIGGAEIAAGRAAAVRPEIIVEFVVGGPVAAGTSPAARPGLAWTLRALFGFGVLGRLRRHAPDVVVFSLWKTGLHLLAWRLLLRRPAILFLHCDRSVHVADQWLTLACAWAADGILADAEATAVARLPAWLRRRKQVAIVSLLSDRPSRTDTEPVRDAGRFVYWGRLSTVKRIDRALELMARLRAVVPGISFELIGPDSGELDALREKAERLGLGDTVRFRGAMPRERLFVEAQGATWFLQLSDYEGFGVGVAEAMQRGLIPVVTAVGEIANYCRHQDNALIVTDLDAVVEQLGALVHDAAARERLSKAAAATWRDQPLYPDDFLAKVDSIVQGLPRRPRKVA